MKRHVTFTTFIVVMAAFALVFASAATGFAQAKSPWQVRVRGLGVMPDDDSTAITTIGGNATVDNSAGVEVDFTYFFMENFAAELVAGVAQHNVEAKGTDIGEVAEALNSNDIVGPEVKNFDLGDVWVIPPTLTLQYHFLPNEKFRPYIGAGVNYTLFVAPNEGTIVNDTDYDNSFGYALQAGADIGLTEKFFFNIDLKKLYLETDAEVKALGTTVKTEVDIDPWLVGVGIGYRF